MSSRIGVIVTFKLVYINTYREIVNFLCPGVFMNPGYHPFVYDPYLICISDVRLNIGFIFSEVPHISEIDA